MLSLQTKAKNESLTTVQVIVMEILKESKVLDEKEEEIIRANLMYAE